MSVQPGVQAQTGNFADVLDEDRQMEKKSTEYLDKKCGVEEGGDEIRTFKYRECRKELYKPGVYLSRKSIGCCSYPPKLYHLVISRKRFDFRMHPR